MCTLFCVNANLFCKLLPVFTRVLHKILSQKLIACLVGENSVEGVVQKVDQNKPAPGLLLCDVSIKTGGEKKLSLINIYRQTYM